MKKIYLSIIAALFTILSVKGETSLTPMQVLDRAVGAVANTKGVEAKFSVNGAGYVGIGQIKTLGSKFKVILPDVEVWYNGATLYTYNKRAGEITIIDPTPEELAETNPLAYITSAKQNYSVSFSTVKKTGKYVLELLPKVKTGGIKRITLTLDKTTFAPEKIVMEPKSGSPLTAEISLFKTGVNVAAGEFEYPKAKYPNVEIVDLR